MNPTTNNLNTNTVVGGQGSMDGQMSEAEMREMIDKMSELELVEVFVRQMMIEKGLDGMDEELTKKIREDLMERVVFQINRALVAALPDDKLELLEKKLEVNPQDGNLGEILEGSGVDVEAVTLEALGNFKKNYLAERENGNN